ncbi:hypothetical protein ACA910_016602 [Epithemia clementina (nom. ined.)]
MSSSASSSTTRTSTPSTLGDSLSFITDICGVLKRLKRTGWVRQGIPFPESDADHMHRCAMCALLLSQPADPRDDYSLPQQQKFHPSKINTTKLLRLTVTHDVCEALAGDITPFCARDQVQSKHGKEQAAMQRIAQVVGDPLGTELYELWLEYEAQETVEAVYAKDIDKFEMVVQAYEYEKLHLQYNNNNNNNNDQNNKRKRKEGPQDNDNNNNTYSDKHNDKNDDDELEPLSGSIPATTMGAAVTNASSCGTTHSDFCLTEPLRTFFQTTNSAIRTPLFRRLDRELRQKRQALLLERGWSVGDNEHQQEPEPEQQQSLPSTTTTTCQR